LLEWISENGIGEFRSAFVEDDRIVEARILLKGIGVAGLKLPVRLITAGRNAIARDEANTEYLLPGGAPGVAEGERFDIVITRTAIPGAERWKRALAKVAMDHEGLTDPITSTAGTLPGSWDDLIEEARSGIVRFAGGELRIETTAAMTVIDVDGFLSPDELAVVGAAEAAKAIRRLDIGGSIGIDLPTTGSKTARQRAAEAIDAVLPHPFERTAVNGFGFVQVVRPRRRASLVELACDRASFEARALLRRITFEAAGPRRIVAHPAVVAVLESHGDWLEAIARQLGGAVRLRADPALPMSGGYAEKA
jgi:hypothetical protein